MKYGLKEHTIEKMNGVFAQFPEVEKVMLYGSRAKGTYRPGSDIDLILVGPALNLKTLFRIETELDDLLLPYMIGLSIFEHIDNPDLLDHIRRVGKVFYQREEAGAEREALLIMVVRVLCSANTSATAATSPRRLAAPGRQRMASSSVTMAVSSTKQPSG